MKYKTYDGWMKENSCVALGEHSHKRNKKGECVFSEDQIIDLLDYDDFMDLYDYCD